MSGLITHTELSGVRLAHRGKVRDVYDLGDELLLVATDRLSAFDCILPTPIPGKGRLLTALSAHWLRWVEPICRTHFITDDVAAFPRQLQAFAQQLSGRAMLVKRARRLDVECVARGYLAGSALREYQAHGTVAGVAMPAGLLPAARLPQPLFTPTTKSDGGHDEPMSMAQLEGLVGASRAQQLKTLTLRVYQEAAHALKPRGLLLADTKLEVGLVGDDLIIIDELLTPDSSRFWDADSWSGGGEPHAFDKQFVRDWLHASGWNKQDPAPALPADVVRKTQERYREAFRRITGREVS